MRLQTIIYLGLVIKTVTGSSFEQRQHESLKSKIKGMCPELKDENIAKVLPVEKLVLMNQLTLVPEYGGKEWTTEVCFYLRHIEVYAHSHTINRIQALLATAISRLIDFLAKNKLYSEYISPLQKKTAPLTSDLIEARNRYDAHCAGEKGYVFFTKHQVEMFVSLPIQAQSAIYFASYGLSNPGKTLAETDKKAVCLQMRYMMNSAWSSLLHDPDEYYLMAIEHAAKVLELVDRPMPPLGQV